MPWHPRKDHARGDHAPGHHQHCDPTSLPDSLHYEVAGQLKYDIASEKYARCEPVAGVAHAEKGLNLQRREADIDAVDIRNHIKKKQQRNETPSHLGKNHILQPAGFTEISQGASFRSCPRKGNVVAFSLHLRILSGPPSRKNLRDSLFRGRKRWEGGVWFLLVPVGDAKNVVGAKIRLPVLDRHFDRFMKTNRCLQVPAVHGKARPGLFSGELNDAYQRRRIQLAEAPGSIKIIFAAGAVDPRRLLTIDRDHLVAFVPRSPLVIQDRHHYADKLPFPLSIQDHVIVFSQWILPARILPRIVEIVPVKITLVPPLAWRALAILGVKIRRIGRDQRQFDPID